MLNIQPTKRNIVEDIVPTCMNNPTQSKFKNVTGEGIMSSSIKSKET